MRHHRRAENADGNVQHCGIGDDRRRGHDKVAEDRPIIGPRKKHLHAEERDDGSDERDDQRLDITESPALQDQDEQDVEPGDEHAVKQRNVEEKLESDGRTDDLGKIACCDGNLGHHPKHEAHLASITLVAKLRQVALCGHAQLERQALQQNRHQV